MSKSRSVCLQDTTQKYYLVVNQVVKKPVEMLVSELKRGKFISKEQVLKESMYTTDILSSFLTLLVQKQASDKDIEATSSVMSLKCPLSAKRLQLPCRGIGCKHNQCFDATSYLQLQEQAPTWQCPVCNKAVIWENLVLDHYVKDILDSTGKDTEQVIVEPDGQWSTQNAAQPNPSRPSNPTPTSDSDDDLVVVETAQHNSRSNPFQSLTPSSVRTPPMRSREDSAAASSVSRSSKRPREVIDLTLSDDDEPPRPTKRPSGNINTLSQIASHSSTNSTSSPSQSMSFRSRPPEQPMQRERYKFHLPPPVPSANFNVDTRFGQPSALGGGGGSSMGGGGGGNPF
jgi:E3 SUMO-protein ligase PIAS1